MASLRNLGAILRRNLQVQRILLLEVKRRALVDEQLTRKLSRELWTTLREIRLKCHVLFPEYLDVAEGILVRSFGLDRGLCGIADAMLKDLSLQTGARWDRFTILGGAEFYGDTARTDLIRLRFPDLSIWSLPIAAHEFGHFFEASQDSLRELLDRDRELGSHYQLHLHEYFADLFATYLLGPSFACTCVLLRFDPSVARWDWATHPSSAKRIYFITKTLERMDHANVDQEYKLISDRLLTIWRALGKAAGQTTKLGKDVSTSLDQLHDELYSQLMEQIPGPYNGWSRAQQVADQLQAVIVRTTTETEYSAHHEDFMRDAKINIPDLLNAAWLLRLRFEFSNSLMVQSQSGDTFQVDRIAHLTFQWCQDLIRMQPQFL